MGLKAMQTWVEILTLSLLVYVALGKLLPFFQLQLLIGCMSIRYVCM